MSDTRLCFSKKCVECSKNGKRVALRWVWQCLDQWLLYTFSVFRCFMSFVIPIVLIENDVTVQHKKNIESATWKNITDFFFKAINNSREKIIWMMNKSGQRLSHTHTQLNSINLTYLNVKKNKSGSHLHNSVRLGLLQQSGYSCPRDWRLSASWGPN